MNKKYNTSWCNLELKRWGMNKSGSEGVLSVWWFLVLAMVGAGIALGVFMFYSADLDVQKLESEVLANKVYDCLNNNGYLRSDIFLDDFDIYKECAINEKMFNEVGSSYYLEVNVSNSGVSLFNSSSKVVSLKSECLVGRGISTKDFPECVIKSESFLFYENNRINHNHTIPILYTQLYRIRLHL